MVEKMKFIKLFPGWIFISLLIYVYVIGQYELISNPILMFLLTIFGLWLSYLLSSAEMAIANCGEDQVKTLAEMSKEIKAQLEKLDENDEQFRRSYHLAESKKISQIQEIIENSSNFNPSIVIANNVVNIAIAALLPSAMTSSSSGIKIPSFFGVENLIKDSFALEYLPFAGVETLTFCSSVLVIIVFGEIIPKRLATDNPLEFTKKRRKLILINHRIFGWLGNSFVALSAPIGWFSNSKK